MPYETFPSTVGPSYPVDKEATPRVKKVEFGDGYTQEGPDGINYLLYVWNLNWEVLNSTEKVEIEAFLVARKGYETFLWVDPDGVEFRVKCRSWTITEFAPKVFTIKATFNQVPL